MRIIKTVYHYDNGDALLIYVNLRERKAKILIGEQGRYRSCCDLKFEQLNIKEY